MSPTLTNGLSLAVIKLVDPGKVALIITEIAHILHTIIKSLGLRLHLITKLIRVFKFSLLVKNGGLTCLDRLEDTMKLCLQVFACLLE